MKKVTRNTYEMSVKKNKRERYKVKEEERKTETM